jgi:hypothetical protein
MTKPEKPSHGDANRVPPDGKAWRLATDEVADRNAEARRQGKQERQAHEKQIAAIRRAQNQHGEVYR